MQVRVLEIVEHMPCLISCSKQVTCQRDSKRHLACPLWAAKHNGMWQTVIVCQVAKAFCHLALSYDVLKIQFL